MKRLLVITGVQNDFFTEPFGSTGMKQILPRIASYVRNWDDDIIVLKETRLTKQLLELGHGTIPGLKPWDEMREHLNVGYPEHCIKWTEGWEIVPSILEELKLKNETSCKFRTVEAYGLTWHDWANNIATYDEFTVIGTKLEDQITATVHAIQAVRPDAAVRLPTRLCASPMRCSYREALDVLENRVIKD